jgi:hypothetical protein
MSELILELIILDIETDKILTDFHHDFNNNVVEAVYKT